MNRHFRQNVQEWEGVNNDNNKTIITLKTRFLIESVFLVERDGDRLGGREQRHCLSFLKMTAERICSKH